MDALLLTNGPSRDSRGNMRRLDLTRSPSNQSRISNNATTERADGRFVSILTGFKSCTLFEGVCRSTLTRTRAVQWLMPVHKSMDSTEVNAWFEIHNSLPREKALTACIKPTECIALLPIYISLSFSFSHSLFSATFIHIQVPSYFVDQQLAWPWSYMHWLALHNDNTNLQPGACIGLWGKFRDTPWNGAEMRAEFNLVCFSLSLGSPSKPI